MTFCSLIHAPSTFLSALSALDDSFLDHVLKALRGSRLTLATDMSKTPVKTEADPIGTRKQAYRKMPDPTFETYGPKPDSEYEALIAERGGLPA
jgi:hypothetical protein